MTWIKVCGMTNAEDARAAVGAGVNAVGFVFHNKGPRKVDAAKAREIVAGLPEGVEKVGVFVNESAERISEIVETARLTAVQLHGTENAEFARNLFRRFNKKVEILRVLHMSQFPPGEEDEKGFDLVAAGILSAEDAETFAALMRDAAVDHGISDEFPAEARKGAIQRVVLDSGPPGEGGTGKTFNWHDCKLFVEAIKTFTNVIIAGGLDAGNVAEAIKLLSPWGVDVASGVESAPGRKDPEKLRAFVKAVRQAEVTS